MAKAARMFIRLTGACLILASNAAFARISAILPCKDAQDKRPCSVAQDGPFNGATPKPGLSAQIVDQNIVISWAGPAKEVTMNGIDYNAPLPLVAGDLRQLVIRYDQAATVKTNVSMNVTQPDGTRTFETVDLIGPRASPAPGAAAVSGKKLSFTGTRLGAQIWLPPDYQEGRRYPIVYVADSGDNRGELVADAIRKGALAPVIVVGIDACVAGDTDARCRSHNYVYMPSQDHLDPARFAAYEKLFIHTVVPQVEAKYGSPPDASQRGVAGESNGAAWAASMALNHPELFGRAIVMSLAGAHFYGPVAKVPTVFALSGGVLEPAFSYHSRCFAGRIVEAGGTATLRLYPAGHSRLMWEEEFMRAMMDWQGVQRAPLALAPGRPAWCPESWGEEK